MWQARPELEVSRAQLDFNRHIVKRGDAGNRRQNKAQIAQAQSLVSLKRYHDVLRVQVRAVMEMNAFAQCQRVSQRVV